ncbi:galactosylceramide sulfotransferase-like [Amphiura filiformis]|uniref:galactosylceramide sulfotransferase-like n=1 Tax=Amphiura filiformis TaxID=82378 RepID=UPI003B2179CB
MSVWEKTVALCFTLIGLLYCYYLYDTNRPMLLEMASSTAVQHNCTSPTCLSSISRALRTSSCKPHNHVVYIKTHKTGSTTLQQVIQMHGFRHRLSFLFNEKSPKNGHIRYSFVSNTTQRKFLPPINIAHGDYSNYRNYDILAAHMKYNRTVLNWYMKNDSKYISIVREPVAQFESAFDFFKIANKMSKRTHGLGLRSPIDQWLNNPGLYLKGLGGPKGTVWVSLNNGQMLDLGLDANDINNITEVKKTVKNLSEELDLVLVTEYFDESLVLLKRLLCWSFEDIVYFSQNQRHRRRRLRESTKHRIRKWNHADMLLYKHFNETLWRKIEEYGPTFHDDLKTFRKTKDKVTRECAVKTEMHLDHKGIVRYRTGQTATRCKLLTDSKELFYEIWKRQSPGSHHVKTSKSDLQHQIATRRHQIAARGRNIPWPIRARARTG